jgi:osmoprotectant transport system substrate-binding protein
MKTAFRIAFNAMAVTAVLVLLAFSSSPKADTIRVGGKVVTEQHILAEITKQMLERRGYKVDKRVGMGSKIVRAALENGEIDVHWEYTGTALINYNKVTDRLSPQETYDRVKKLDEKVGLIWLKPSRSNSTYAFVVRPGNPKTDKIISISDMAAAYKSGVQIQMATTAEFAKRPDGLPGIQETYGFEAGRANVRPMDPGLAYVALANGDLDVLVSDATTGQIAAFKLRLLKDDKNFFTHYAVAPVVRKSVLDAHPDLKEPLESIAAKIDDAALQKMNADVDVNRKSVEATAAEFLASIGM